MSYCHTNTSGVHRPSTLENKYSNILFYKITGPTVLQFHMKHDLTPGSQNCKIGSGQISKMAAVTKNSKNNKINFFFRTTGYFWLNFGMEYQWNIGIQNYNHSVVFSQWPTFYLLALFCSISMSKNNIFLQLQTTSSLKPLHQLLANFTWNMTWLQGFRILKLG